MKYLMLVLGLMLSITAFAEGDYCETACSSICAEKGGIKYCVADAVGEHGAVTGVCVCNSKPTTATSSSSKSKGAVDASSRVRSRPPLNQR